MCIKNDEKFDRKYSTVMIFTGYAIIDQIYNKHNPVQK